MSECLVGDRQNGRIVAPSTDNPDGDTHDITSKTLFTEALPVGQSWSLAVMLMEKDDGTSQHF